MCHFWGEPGQDGKRKRQSDVQWEEEQPDLQKQLIEVLARTRIGPVAWHASSPLVLQWLLSSSAANANPISSTSLRQAYKGMSQGALPGTGAQLLSPGSNGAARLPLLQSSHALFGRADFLSF